MAEESSNQTQENQEVGQQQGAGEQIQEVQDQNQGANVIDDEAGSRLRAIGHLLSDKDRQEIEASMSTGDESGQGKEGRQAPAAAAEKKDDKEAGTAAASGSGKADDKKAGTEEKPQGKPSIFGLGKKKDDKGPELVIENADQILQVINKEFGMQLKELKEVSKFFEVNREWRNKSQQFEKVNKDHTAILKELEELPAEFHEAFKAYAAGEDWKAPFVANTNKLDFKIPADKQDTKTLVETYYGKNKFTDEDFAATEKSPALELAISLAKDKYNFEREKNESLRATKVAASKKQIEDYNTSLSDSVENLSKAFPDMEQDVLKEMRSIFEGGPRKVVSHFFNDNGTVKPDAMRKFAMALHGESEIQRMMEFASHVGETKANEEIISRGADGPDPRRSSGKHDTVPEEVAKKIAEFDRLGKVSSQRTF